MSILVDTYFATHSPRAEASKTSPLPGLVAPLAGVPKAIPAVITNTAAPGDLADAKLKASLAAIASRRASAKQSRPAASIARSSDGKAWERGRR